MCYLRKVLRSPGRLIFLSLLVVVFIGCKSDPVTISIPVPSLPPIRPLTTDVFSRVTYQKALQYYISTWVILEYVGIPPYPDTIGVTNVTTHPKGPQPVPSVKTSQGEAVEQSYEFLMDFPPVNPSGVGHIQYENLNRIILIKEQTRGVLLDDYTDEADGRRVLQIGFEEGNNNTLAFKEDPSGEYFYLSPGGNGTEIEYGGHPYRQLMRVRPLLMVRINENIESTLPFYQVRGRIPSETGSANR